MKKVLREILFTREVLSLNLICTVFEIILYLIKGFSYINIILLLLFVFAYGFILLYEYTIVKKDWTNLKFVPNHRKFSYIIRSAWTQSIKAIQYFPKSTVTAKYIEHIKNTQEYRYYIVFVPKKYWDICHIRVSCYKTLYPLADIESLRQKILNNPYDPVIGRRLFDRGANLCSLRGQVLTGLDFNRYMNGHGYKLTKLLYIDEIHYDIDYSGGGKFIDSIKFYPISTCKAGGMYFTIDDEKHVEWYRNISDTPYIYKRSVTIPNKAFVYFEQCVDKSGDQFYKFKTDEFILGKKRRLIKKN
jgi:hypothetical protein